MPTTVSVATDHGVTTHKISLKGLTGAILYCLVIALLFALVAFVTEGWAQVTTEKGGVRVGLWMTCLCQPNLVDFTVESWFRGSQAMITIGFVCLGISSFSITLYAFVHNLNKNRVLKLVLICSFLTVVFTATGLAVFGMYTMSYQAMQGFSYVFSIITCLLCILACILSCVQLHRSRTFECCSCCKCCGDRLD